MIRLEIIANHSVEENILEALTKAGVGKYYTKYPVIFGVGSSGPRMGDPIWPEENFALVIWCEEEEARAIKLAVEGVKERFPNEGIKVYGLAEAAAAQKAEAAAEATAEPKAAPGEDDLAGYFVAGVD
ncbi:MAG: hypothetical protein LBQ94_09920 [Treponema sp.]|jgi:hypothetical protein|nr:hypothetical protein [Treponema sp.]